MKLQRLLSYTRKACDDYGMIAEHDKIAVGISGGKDSLSLLLALHALRRFYPHAFSLHAITVSLGFSPEMVDRQADFSVVAALCKSIDVPYTVLETNIGKVVFEDRKEKNPCSLCANMRKGALNKEAKRLGCNKIAYGHNKDDAIETFFMSLFYEGRIHNFCPVTYLDRMDLTVVRPLLYVPEEKIVAFAKENNLPIVKSPCPANGCTKRQELKNFVREQRKQFHDFDEKVFVAMKNSSLQGWQTTPSQPNNGSAE